MPEQSRSERETQHRVARMLVGLGYEHLGFWTTREDNRPIEAELLRANLLQRGYSEAHVSAALQRLLAASDVTGVTLYEANRRTYELLRFGVPVSLAVGQPHETVHLIDWDGGDNHFALAEEVTLRGGYERRPDIVLYINGIAVAVIELKRSSVEVGDGVRQLITNQDEIFNKNFFSTVQLLLAGSDSQGLRYGTTGTPEQFFVQWKDEAPRVGEVPGSGDLLDRPLSQVVRPDRLMDLIKNCVIFDAGQKKVPRPHQFFAMKAAQERLSRREGGVIWHTQGSGKSILMVLLAKWILENDPNGRILILTDREELDKQIEEVVRNAGVIGESAQSPRVKNRYDFRQKLESPQLRVLSSLIHKHELDLTGDPPKITGQFYVFVDECHRTQSGDLHKQMKRWFLGAIFIGFTGTPLLKRYRPLTRDLFGTYIHTYKFQEGVRDGVILDLKYEARNVPQQLTSQASIDSWFESATGSLNNYQKAVLKRYWAGLEKLMSTTERKQRIIASILMDFRTKARLNTDRGTAILVASSIYDACDYFRLFQATPFASFVGLITSYNPSGSSISREPAGSDERMKHDVYERFILRQGQTVEAYETECKRRFKDEPANMKLLIVVGKLLTGFDAPSCTYIYLDNELKDHNLFQAICRTNRLDGDDKAYGHIVDFKKQIGRSGGRLRFG